MGSDDSVDSPWIGDRFRHGPERERPNFLAFRKSILPTSNIFQAALHKPGACRLKQEWTSCANKVQLVRDDDTNVDQFMCFQKYVRPYRAHINELLTSATDRKVFICSFIFVLTFLLLHTHTHVYLKLHLKL